jgi:dTDP-4-dehydrorhamnose 3,5-epimerase
MKVARTALPGVVVIEAQLFRDERGCFSETWSQARYAGAGLPECFVQDNASASRPGVLRGLHLQHPEPQGKLVTVVAGEVYDVAVDVRLGSPTFGRWVAVTLSAETGRQVYLPPGFAHGFVVTSSEPAVVTYKCTSYYRVQCDLSIAWDDPELGIQWPVRNPLVSAKDRGAPRLRDVPAARLPAYAV